MDNVSSGWKKKNIAGYLANTGTESLVTNGRHYVVRILPGEWNAAVMLSKRATETDGQQIFTSFQNPER